MMGGGRLAIRPSLFYEFWLEDRVPKEHLLRRIDVFVTSGAGRVRAQLQPYYSEIGRRSVDPELMMRMLIFLEMEEERKAGKLAKGGQGRHSMSKSPRFLSPSRVSMAANRRVRSTSHGW